MRDPSEVDFEGMLGTMADYLAECMMTHGYKNWRWNVSPRFFYELRKQYINFGNPPRVEYGESNAMLWGVPVVVTTFVEDAELEEVR